jgi:hypothetical protein
MAFFRAHGGQQPGALVDALGKLDAAIGGLLFIFIGMGITAWMGSARVVRAQVLAVRQNEYIAAARALGLPTRRIIRRHILPNGARITVALAYKRRSDYNGRQQPGTSVRRERSPSSPLLRRHSISRPCPGRWSGATCAAGL